MKVTFLGQAGLLFETLGQIIMVDPYFSDSVAKLNPKNQRRVPVNERFLELRPDVLIFTHHHADHYDSETVERLLKGQNDITVLSPKSVWEDVRKYGGTHNYVQLNRHTSWTEGGVRFTAVKAEHSDPCAIGVLLEAEDKKYYITGDTLYNDAIFADIPENVHAVFLPMNGVGNNMNPVDAGRFAARIHAKYTVPVHFGMFDELDPKNFDCPNRVIPQIYEEIPL